MDIKLELLKFAFIILNCVAVHLFVNNIVTNKPVRQGFWLAMFLGCFVICCTLPPLSYPQRVSPREGEFIIISQ